MMWPVFADEASRFHKQHMSRPAALFKEFGTTTPGSGKPAGPRELLWQSVSVFSVAALEAGLEDLLLGAHAVRQGCEGLAASAGNNSTDANPKRWLVEDPLMAPSAVKIDRLLFAQFGLLLGDLPAIAQFEVRRKAVSNGGDGKGSAVAGPTTWAELAVLLNSLSHIRNATAHADAKKLTNLPATGQNDLWVLKQNGSWSIQKPHALTAMRCVMSAFNAVAAGLATVLDVPVPAGLVEPNSLAFPT